MKCKNCGTTVLESDQACKKCGATLIGAAEAYSADQQYRSRFTLVFRAWIGATSGFHLKWLGYTSEAKEIKQSYGLGLSTIFNPWKLVGSLVYQCAECIGVIFGKYRTDANGYPVRYFKPKENR